MQVKFEDFKSPESVIHAMRQMGIKEVTTNRQRYNGTKSFQLSFIENTLGGRRSQESCRLVFASYKSGYIRKTSGCYTCYQLNKTYMAKELWWSPWSKEYTWLYRKQRVLVKAETDRLVLLFNYILRNYICNIDGKDWLGRPRFEIPNPQA